MNARFFFCLVACFAASILPASAQAAKGADAHRIALIFGNGDYQHVRTLTNPVNDARDMAARLGSQGFDVTALTDAKQREMEDAIRDFVHKLYRPQSVGLFFYAGHALEVGGRNFLMPVDAEVHTEADVKYEAIDAGRILDSMLESRNSLNLVILDACRDNPYSSFTRSNTQGLAAMKPAAGTLVFYATEPGKQAKDGTGRNGVFTKHLLEKMDRPGLKVEEVFKQTAVAVREETAGAQTPWWEGVIIGEFYFQEAGQGDGIPGSAGGSAAPDADPPSPVPEAVSFWLHPYLVVFYGVALLWIVVSLYGVFIRPTYHLTPLAAEKASGDVPDFLKPGRKSEIREAAERAAGVTKQEEASEQGKASGRWSQLIRIGAVVLALGNLIGVSVSALARVERTQELFYKLTTFERWSLLVEEYWVGLAIALLIILAETVRFTRGLLKRTV